MTLLTTSTVIKLATDAARSHAHVDSFRIIDDSYKSIACIAQSASIIVACLALLVIVHSAIAALVALLGLVHFGIARQYR